LHQNRSRTVADLLQEMPMARQPRGARPEGKATPPGGAGADVPPAPGAADERLRNLKIGAGGDRGFAQPTDKHRGGTQHVSPQLRDETDDSQTDDSQ
jgi:hypothetical protein